MTVLQQSMVRFRNTPACLAVLFLNPTHRLREGGPGRSTDMVQNQSPLSGSCSA